MLAAVTATALALQGCGAPLTFFVAPVQPVHVGTPQVMPHAIPTDLRQWGAWAVGSF